MLTITHRWKCDICDREQIDTFSSFSAYDTVFVGGPPLKWEIFSGQLVCNRHNITVWAKPEEKPKPCPTCGRNLLFVDVQRPPGEKHGLWCECGFRDGSFGGLPESMLLAAWEGLNPKADDKPKDKK